MPGAAAGASRGEPASGALAAVLASRGSRILMRLAPIACVLAILLLARRAVVMPASPRPVRSPAIVTVRPKPYPPAVERNYRFRIRQLESDLARDPGEYLILSRLGLLHLRLAGHASARETAASDYGAARSYFNRAAWVARTRREYEWALLQRDACAERAPATDATDGYPHTDLIAAPPPPSVDLEAQLRLRAQFLEVRAREMPGNTRLLVRLGLTYVRLSEAITARERRAKRAIAKRRPAEPTPIQGSVAPWGEPLPELTVADCRRLAREKLAAALRRARCRELRAESYRAMAELYRAAGDPVSSLGMLRRVVELQPNNWPAQVHIAGLLARLGRDKAARQAEALADRWRTPEWL